MINFIIVTHGEFGAYLVEAAEGIIGRQEKGVRVVSTSSRQSVPEIKRRIERSLAELSSEDGIILFTDMPGGTPNNLSFPLIRNEKRVEMVSGVNLYMLITAFGQRDKMSVEKLVEKIVADGQKSIRDIRAMFLAAAGGR